MKRENVCHYFLLGSNLECKLIKIILSLKKITRDRQGSLCKLCVNSNGEALICDSFYAN